MAQLTFVLTNEETERILEWKSKHAPADCGASGGRYRFVFIPTRLGTITQVQDIITGAKLDLTDYDSW